MTGMTGMTVDELDRMSVCELAEHIDYLIWKLRYKMHEEVCLDDVLQDDSKYARWLIEYFDEAEKAEMLIAAFSEWDNIKVAYEVNRTGEF